jgi:four helix bundle protein
MRQGRLAGIRVPAQRAPSVRKMNWPGIGYVRAAMGRKESLSDQLEERLIEFAARIVTFSSELGGTPAGKHIAMQMLRPGTAPAPNYAEARGAESRADFIHKLGIVQKELNETSVWLRILLKTVADKRENIVAVLVENQELCRIVGASVRTAKAGMR